MVFVIISLIVNLVISFIFASEGSNREVGSSKAFWYTFMLSPFIGAIVVFTSPIKVIKQTIHDSTIINDEITEMDLGIVYVKNEDRYRLKNGMGYRKYVDAVKEQKSINQSNNILIGIIITVTVVIFLFSISIIS